MKKTTVIGVLVAVAVAAFGAFKYAESKKQARESQVERGRYLVTIGGCNDCHTPGYGLSGGKVDEALWLTGDSLGWQGPWGTTYAINLRNYVQALTEEQWVQIVAKMQSRPPMPYFNLQRMKEEDLRAMYQYIRAAGPAGAETPPYLPPGVEATTPVVVFPAPPPA